ncbi:hypothetical protein V6N11_018824 [Hibiscus sabdariffa]|uniref:Uncharacterized protein n=2 Tax=Hibiscus sabdariffa TaxID=183260 RepID=A0ABR1ZLC4_9ROSI
MNRDGTQPVRGISQEGHWSKQSKQRRQIEGVIDVDKIAIVKNCALGFSRRPYRIVELANKFRKAGLNGFSIMRITGSMIILMFDDEDKRKEVLAAEVLDERIENLGNWIPLMPIPNRRT